MVPLRREKILLLEKRGSSVSTDLIRDKLVIEAAF